MEPIHQRHVDAVLGHVWLERAKQDTRWGEQNHRDGSGGLLDQNAAYVVRMRNDERVAAGDSVTWTDILREEVYEAFAEPDSQRLRNELIQVAAVACAWVEAIDRRQSTDR